MKAKPVNGGLAGPIAAVPVGILAWVSWFRSSPRPSFKLMLTSTLLTGLSLLAACGVLMKLAPDA